MDVTPTFASFLRQIRIAGDLTQEGLAEAVGCATQTIRSFEIGRRRPSREMATRMADVLQLPAAAREQLIRLARAPLATRKPEPADVSVATTLAPTPNNPNGAKLSMPLDALIGRHAELAYLRASACRGSSDNTACTWRHWQNAPGPSDHRQSK